MQKIKTSKSIRLHPGRRKSHGGYSYLTTGNLPENRAYIERYLTETREGLVRDLGPTEEDLTTAQIVIMDRIISKLGIIRCIEEHIRENSVMIGDNLAPSLGKNYISYNNSVRLDLEKLGIDKRKGDEVFDLQEYAREKYGKKKAK